MKTICKQYQKEIVNHWVENEQGAKKIGKIILKSPLTYHHYRVRTLQIPKVFSKKDQEVFKHAVSTTYKILEKVIREYLSNAEYRKAFPFSKELEELILIPNLYDSLLPIARFDIFYNEETSDFKFCEINTDGTSAMIEDQLLNEYFQYNPAHRTMNERYHFTQMELFDSWVESFASLYQTYQKKVDSPHIAIVDFLEGGSINEFAKFRKHFQNAGFKCDVYEIRDLTYDGSRLLAPDGSVIDAIYRRAVTTDIINHIDEVQPFIQAVKDQKVCLIGSFCTQIAHHKWLFMILHEEVSKKLLTDEENAFVEQHIPYTGILSDENCDQDEIIRTKDRWIIKPMDSYGSRGVFAGCDASEEEWKQHIQSFINKGYIYQEYCPPYRTMNIDFLEENPAIKPYTNMSGLYVYNGIFSGVYSRLSDGGIISSQYNERSVPSYFTK